MIIELLDQTVQVEYQSHEVRQVVLDVKNQTAVVHGVVNGVYAFITEPFPLQYGDDYNVNVVDYLNSLELK